jgi:hypothetical protein
MYNTVTKSFFSMCKIPSPYLAAKHHAYLLLLSLSIYSSATAFAANLVNRNTFLWNQLCILCSFSSIL